MRRRFAGLLGVVWIAAVVNAQAQITFNPTTVTMKVGESKDATVTPPDTAATALKFDAAILDVAVQSGTLKITGKKAGTTSITAEGAAAPLTVTVTHKPTKITVTPEDPVIIERRQQTMTFAITDEEGEAYTPTSIQMKPGDNSVTAENNVLKAGSVTGEKVVPVAVTVDGVTLPSFNATVREGIARIEGTNPQPVVEGSTLDLFLRLIGEHGTTFSAADRPVKFDYDKNLFEVTQEGIVRAKTLRSSKKIEPDQAAVTVKSFETVSGNPIENTFKLGINLSGGELRFSQDRVSLPPGGASPPIIARVVNRDDQALSIKKVTWTVKDRSNSQYVAVSPVGNPATIVWRDADTEQKEKQRPPFVEVVATATTFENSEQIVGSVFVFLLKTVATFAPLHVRLNVMDDLTAADLYGGKTADDYYVSRVRLNNNFKKDVTGEFSGASILAFSDSIEVAVHLQKLADGKEDKQGNWQDVTDQDLANFTMMPTSTITNDSKEPQCKGFITYRPYLLEMMVNTVDRRDERSKRSKLFRILNGVGTVASFVTSVAVPGPSSDAPLALEKFSNLLIPGIERLWPSLKETNRQNIVSQTMRNIEEIPFGSDVSRVLFFPKRSFRGLLKDHRVRISEICPFYFNIEVAVLKKDAKGTVTNAAAPAN